MSNDLVKSKKHNCKIHLNTLFFIQPVLSAIHSLDSSSMFQSSIKYILYRNLNRNQGFGSGLKPIGFEPPSLLVSYVNMCNVFNTDFLIYVERLQQFQKHQ